MRRRKFIGLVVGGVIGSGAFAVAQGRSKVPRIGILVWGYPGRDIYWEPFREALRELGYVEGRDVELNVRFAESSRERASAALRNFIEQSVDLIVASQTPSAHAAKAATSTIPIVVAPIADALATGLIASFARPGGNLTGVSSATPEAIAKGLEALRQVIPELDRVGFSGLETRSECAHNPAASRNDGQGPGRAGSTNFGRGGGER